jgi:hypothetical protein
MRLQRNFQRNPHYALKRAKHTRHAEANYSAEQPKPLKTKLKLNRDARQHGKLDFNMLD